MIETKKDDMITRKTIPMILGCLLLMLAIVSCGKGDGSSTENDTVAFKIKKVSDTSSFKRSNGEMCRLHVDAEFSIPEKINGKAASSKFVKLFASTVLEGGDSLDLENAVKQIVATRLSVNVSDVADASEEECGNATSKVDIQVKVYPVYNRNGVLSMCFEEVVKKDGVPSVAHTYYNYDVEKCSVLDNGEFVESSIDELAQLLRNKLMEQNKVTTPEELNSIGYFDIENLNVSSNFYFIEDGVVWSYKPQELTVDANVEPTISVPFAELVQFVKEESAINNLM
ncbi:MAG: RsiV family protein [Bacteroidales bacterium]|nr:RsiV family protein [Bacteroidales bacterium]